MNSAPRQSSTTPCANRLVLSLAWMTCPERRLGAGTGAAERLRPLAARCRGLRGFGHLPGGLGDSHQAGQAWPLEDLADVVERDDQFLEPVQRSVVLPVQQDAAVLLGSDSPAGQLDLPALGAEQGLDGGVESERQRGELGGGEGTLA